MISKEKNNMTEVETIEVFDGDGAILMDDGSLSIGPMSALIFDTREEAEQYLEDWRMNNEH